MAVLTLVSGDSSITITPDPSNPCGYDIRTTAGGGSTSISAGTNVTITGAGTAGDPYVINSGAATIVGDIITLADGSSYDLSTLRAVVQADPATENIATVSGAGTSGDPYQILAVPLGSGILQQLTWTQVNVVGGYVYTNNEVLASTNAVVNNPTDAPIKALWIVPSQTYRATFNVPANVNFRINTRLYVDGIIQTFHPERDVVLHFEGDAGYKGEGAWLQTYLIPLTIPANGSVTLLGDLTTLGPGTVPVEFGVFESERVDSYVIQVGGYQNQ